MTKHLISVKLYLLGLPAKHCHSTFHALIRLKRGSTLYICLRLKDGSRKLACTLRRKGYTAQHSPSGSLNIYLIKRSDNLFLCPTLQTNHPLRVIAREHVGENGYRYATVVCTSKGKPLTPFYVLSNEARYSRQGTIATVECTDEGYLSIIEHTPRYVTREPQVLATIDHAVIWEGKLEDLGSDKPEFIQAAQAAAAKVIQGGNRIYFRR